MSVKTVAVLDQSDLADGQMKEVEFEKGKVLLSRLGDKIHATSAFCTHYGAPLAKGVLTADGRVVCPWHGACFNVCTGDIEDAPAPDAIHSFNTHVTDGKIYVTADPSKVTSEAKSRPPKLLASGFEGTVGGTAKNGVVIVGGGSGAFHTVESLREHGYKGPITMISKEPYAPIDRTKLSKALITDASKLEWRTPADLKIKYGLSMRTGTAITAVDAVAKSVTLSTGEQMAYDTLVLASGGTPRTLPVEGADLGNVFTLRTVKDAQAIDALCQEGKRLVVVGSSFISMELVVAVAKRKLAAIEVVGMEEVPFEAVLGKQVGAGLMKYHESQGVKFHMKSKLDRLVPSSSDPSKVGGVVVAGQTIPADVVVMGVGVAPATEYLKSPASKGFAVDDGNGQGNLEKGGAVLVDEYLRVKGVKDVYAVGDIAMYPQPGTGEMRRIEHWNVAGNQGRAAGKSIAGDAQPFVKIPVFWSAQGQQLRYVGVGAQFEDVIVEGDPGEMKFIAYYVKGGKIVAVASMQKDPVVSKASELMRLGLMPSPEEVRAGKDLLGIDISTQGAKARVGA
ncbi:hypothetical protein GLOTRDRAFT_64447 [Gloeophyllum trabeum ATCC 11539]|uniref:Rieske domain-containing protein n=1 Tax=Gloeophyllum trabeum (strain ATCC 11539 / FP-39264 / Madison 617) TaxID=670483 RepID=S7PZ31_GLOTA|nr:uncharacterized protein GLOTRDRAFT_64447 [Gloeophyllum trabeum ATCC 11539]EPQ52733.1 hypothetical protein GLOTRDRAFT_64447 [Gloeophyllum trabeum ATCC 11539]